MIPDNIKKYYLCAVRKNNPEDKTHSLKDLPAETWEEILAVADSHFLTPYIYRNIESIADDLNIQKDIIQRMRNTYYFSAGKYAKWSDYLGKILKKFSSAGIPVIVLKGAFLSEVIYGNIALRMMDDIDLLIRKEDYADAEKILKEIEKKSAGQNILIELQLNIVYPHSHVKVDIDKLWGRVVEVEIAGQKAMALSPEDLVLHLCMHASLSHLFDHAGMRGYVDLYESLEQYKDSFDWKYFLRTANEMKIRNSTYMMLKLVKELLKAAVSDEVTNSLAPDSIPEEIDSWAMGRIFKEEEIYSPSRNVDQFWVAQSAGGKFRLMISSVFPNPESIAEKYHTRLTYPRIYLYYPVHIKDLFRHHLGNMFRMLTGDKKMRRIVNFIDWLSRD